ncbi:MAG: hypothetical protein AB7F64_07175 [Gammaproteobacteria bacterium]
MHDGLYDRGASFDPSGTYYQPLVMLSLAFEAHLECERLRKVDPNDDSTFRIYPEREEFGKFDDIVISYKVAGVASTRALQVKHHNTAYTLHQLCEDNKQHKVALYMYFDSWLDIREKHPNLTCELFSTQGLNESAVGAPENKYTKYLKMCIDDEGRFTIQFIMGYFTGAADEVRGKQEIRFLTAYETMLKSFLQKVTMLQKTN